MDVQQKEETDQLTGNLERRVSADGVPYRIPSHTPINTGILLLLAAECLQEEQRAHQEHAMRILIHVRRRYALTVLEPLDVWFGTALGLTVERDRLIFRHRSVGRMFCYPRRAELTWNATEKSER